MRNGQPFSQSNKANFTLTAWVLAERSIILSSKAAHLGGFFVGAGGQGAWYDVGA
jgi:hypothetical protein